MPFGAEVLPGGDVRFALWAPAARSVELSLDDGESPARILPMAGTVDGWYTLRVPGARHGARYYYRIDGELMVADPAARFQPGGVHGASEVVDPCAFRWRESDWRGRPWEEAVIYELHVGAFTPAGDFGGVVRRLDHLAGLGVTAIELMPVATFPGGRNWGYDGTLLFAPHPRYGRPEDLKSLVDAAHARGIMVLLDVVYNHFGPEGNYLGAYAPQFFTDRHHTPWGAAIDFDGPHSRTVRDFYIHNALYWLEEYCLDGLRFDAVHAIIDDSDPHILAEIAARISERFGEERIVHLVLENDANDARLIAGPSAAPRCGYTAQWNDDIHHALHVLATGENGGYYADYADAPDRHLARCLAEGFAWQGEPSAYRGGTSRGQPSAHLEPTAFVAFIQNHDQVGNRAFGERIASLVDDDRLHALITILLLEPAPPLLFMGEEWGCRQPFPFFCDFGRDLATAVVEGRRNEFARFPAFADPHARARIPDPQDEATFRSAILDWRSLGESGHRLWYDRYRALLEVRRTQIAPRLRGARSDGAGIIEPRALRARWTLGDGTGLTLLARVGSTGTTLAAPPGAERLYATHDVPDGALPPWSAAWYLDAPP